MLLCVYFLTLLASFYHFPLLLPLLPLTMNVYTPQRQDCDTDTDLQLKCYSSLFAVSLHYHMHSENICPLVNNGCLYSGMSDSSHGYAFLRFTEPYNWWWSIKPPAILLVFPVSGFPALVFLFQTT